VNTNDGPITVAAHLKGAGYSGPKDLALQPGAHGVYPLTFTPPGIGTYQVRYPCVGQAGHMVAVCIRLSYTVVAGWWPTLQCRVHGWLVSACCREVHHLQSCRPSYFLGQSHD
jgi:hypothetical protein